MALRLLRSNACRIVALCLLLLGEPTTQVCATQLEISEVAPSRERISINDGWKFQRTTTIPDKLIYDRRPDVSNSTDLEVLKDWILPTANDFIADPAKRHQRPVGSPKSSVIYVQKGFDDSSWKDVTLPHDWAIAGPFLTEPNPIIGGGMGRLPVHGIAWYRRKLSKSAADEGKLVYLDIDGAMSYAMVWLNGNLVGGWPYGYNSFRLDLTPFLQPGDENQLAIRLDNPPDSSRWYPGGGIYRNVWLTKVKPVHVAQWGTYITTKNVSKQAATVDITIEVENKGTTDRQIEVVTLIHDYNSTAKESGEKVAELPKSSISIPAGQKRTVNVSVIIQSPRLWGPPPAHTPNLYAALTRLVAGDEEIDAYETTFGIRSLNFDPRNNLMVNGERVRIQGVNQHHDLGALGAAFNYRAAERQLEILKDLGCNSIRMSHNPPAPELLELTDRMGFLVMNEVFDCWEREKSQSDFHLIFPEWHEADLRSFIRRDKNHPSIIAWSVGNEVGEQYTDAAGAAIGQRLVNIAHEEDPTRPVTASMNYAKPDMPFPGPMDILSLNYQGEGIRDAPAYAHLQGIKTPPLYREFQKKFPNKLILSSETAAALSTRGTYFFPVTSEISAPYNDTSGGNSKLQQISAYELYTAPFGSSADKVFQSQDNNSYVAGELVWSGWDYLGEASYNARSSYYGIIDLAGFKKDRYYIYQSRWRPSLRMAHILPHWSWPDRVGLVTPVHVFSIADEAELFLNGVSQGRRRRGEYRYRFRWDEVVYQPGELRVVTYKNGAEWATDTVRTTSAATQLRLTADRSSIKGDGLDLSFLTLEVLDSRGDVVPEADNSITFSITGPAEIAATDNGNPADFTSFVSKERKAFSGLALAIVRAKPKSTGRITVTASGVGLQSATVSLEAH
jgi:beta-galactosidase